METPCVQICRLDTTHTLCIGCGRTKREIRAWKKLDKDDKRIVLAESALRLLALEATGRRKKK